MQYGTQHSAMSNTYSMAHNTQPWAIHTVWHSTLSHESRKNTAIWTWAWNSIEQKGTSITKSQRMYTPLYKISSSTPQLRCQSLANDTKQSTRPISPAQSAGFWKQTVVLIRAKHCNKALPNQYRHCRSNTGTVASIQSPKRLLADELSWQLATTEPILRT